MPYDFPGLDRSCLSESNMSDAQEEKHPAPNPSDDIARAPRKSSQDYPDASHYTLLTESYDEAVKNWPQHGQHILAQYDEHTVVVYQAFNHTIAAHAVKHQEFSSCATYGEGRMTWIKTNFLWMMYRSGWAAKHNQERILAIWMKRDYFEEVLALTRPHQRGGGRIDSRIEIDRKNSYDQHSFIRLQWDPDHKPNGAKHPRRRAIQLGLKRCSSFANGEGLIKIEDVTDFVREQNAIRVAAEKAKERPKIMVPRERVYPLTDKKIATHIMLDELNEVLPAE